MAYSINIADNHFNYLQSKFKIVLLTVQGVPEKCKFYGNGP